MNSTKQIKVGAIISYITIAFYIITGLLFTPWLIKSVGMEDYGIYSLALSVIGLFMMDFGLGSATSRFISKYVAENDKVKINNFIGLAYKFYIIIDFVVMIVLLVYYIFIEKMYPNFSSSAIDKLQTVFLISSTSSIIVFFFTPIEGILVSHERFIFSKVCNLLNKVLIIALSVTALLMGKGLYAIVAINAIVNILIIVMKQLYVKNKIGIKPNYFYYDKELMKQITSFSFWVTVSAIAQRLIMNFAPMILGLYSNAVQISIFSLGTTIEAYMATFASAINGMFMAKVTRLTTASETKSDIEDLMIKVGRIQFLIIGVMLAGLVSLGQEFFELWIGDNFKDIYIVSVILSIPYIITATQEIASIMLYATNKLKPRGVISIINMIITLPLFILLVPKMGAVGASISIFASSVVGNIILINILYVRELKINILRFFKECHLKLIPLVLLTIALGIVMEISFPHTSWLFFIIRASIMILFYSCLAWLFFLNRDEKTLLTSFMFVAR